MAASHGITGVQLSIAGSHSNETMVEAKPTSNKKPGFFSGLWQKICCCKKNKVSSAQALTVASAEAPPELKHSSAIINNAISIGGGEASLLSVPSGSIPGQTVEDQTEDLRRDLEINKLKARILTDFFHQTRVMADVITENVTFDLTKIHQSALNVRK